MIKRYKSWRIPFICQECQQSLPPSAYGNTGYIMIRDHNVPAICDNCIDNLWKRLYGVYLNANEDDLSEMP